MCRCVCRCVLKYSRHIPVPIYTAPPDVYAESSHCSDFGTWSIKTRPPRNLLNDATLSGGGEISRINSIIRSYLCYQCVKTIEFGVSILLPSTNCRRSFPEMEDPGR